MDQAKYRELIMEHQAAVQKVKEVQEKMSTLQQPMSRLMAQINESEMVKKELEIIGDDDAVFKLMGPVMVKQDTSDARTNVASRLKYLTDEMARKEDEIKELQKEQAKNEAKLQSIMKQFEALQAAAMAAAEKSKAQGGKKGGK